MAEIERDLFAFVPSSCLTALIQAWTHTTARASHTHARTYVHSLARERPYKVTDHPIKHKSKRASRMARQ